MEGIHIKGTDVSPEVIFNPAEKIYTLAGWSRPESPSKFYGPILKWIEEHGAAQMNDVTIEFKIEYFNTPSARVLREILDQLDKLFKKGSKISINWYFDDDSSKEEFEYEFAQGLSVPVNFLQKAD